MAPVIRAGRIGNSEENIPEKLVAWFWAFVNAIYFFIQTLINPDASGSYSAYGRKKGWGDGNGRKPGGGGGSGTGPRISGMSDLGGGGSCPPKGGCCGCG